MPEFIVLGAKRYDFTNNGERVAGAKITYLDEPEDDPNQRGHLPITVNCDIALFDKFGFLPGRYNMDFSMRPDAKGKPVVVLRNAEFIEKVEIKPVTLKKAAVNQ